MSAQTLLERPGRSPLPGAQRPPDRLTLWPLDEGQYGLDLSFAGAWGCEDAEQLALHLRARGLPHVLRPDADGAWTVRLGPLSSLQVAGALDAVVGT
jgi:hypothetical protein